MYSEPPASSNSTKSKSKSGGKSKKSKGFYGSIENLFEMLNNQVAMLNSSKLFAGLMIITLNISSKFVTIKLSKSVESYLKYTFSRNILIFTIAWMGTREIYIATFITLLFILCMDYLFNEDSMWCCLPENFTNYHIGLLENKITEEDFKRAKEVVDKYYIQNSNGSIPPSTNNPSNTTENVANTDFKENVTYTNFARI